MPEAARPSDAVPAERLLRLTERAEFLVREGRLVEARRAYRDYLKLRPGDAVAMNSLMHLCIQLGDQAEASELGARLKRLQGDVKPEPEAAWPFERMVRVGGAGGGK